MNRTRQTVRATDNVSNQSLNVFQCRRPYVTVSFDAPYQPLNTFINSISITNHNQLHFSILQTISSIVAVDISAYFDVLGLIIVM